MTVAPTIEVAKKSIKQCVELFNEKFKGEYLVQDLENLKTKYEKAYKLCDSNCLENFKMFTTIEIVLLILETLCLDRVNTLTLNEEEIKIAAQELYERWV